MADESSVWSDHTVDPRSFWGGPWGPRGGRRWCRRRGFPFGFFPPDFGSDFTAPHGDSENQGPCRFPGPPPHCPRRTHMDSHSVFRPGHPFFGRRDQHYYTVDVYPYRAKNTTVKVEQGNLVIDTNCNDRHQTIQKFKLPEDQDREGWMVEQEDTETMVILMTRSKKQKQEQSSAPESTEQPEQKASETKKELNVH